MTARADAGDDGADAQERHGPDPGHRRRRRRAGWPGWPRGRGGSPAGAASRGRSWTDLRKTGPQVGRGGVDHVEEHHGGTQQRDLRQGTSSRGGRRPPAGRRRSRRRQRRDEQPEGDDAERQQAGEQAQPGHRDRDDRGDDAAGGPGAVEGRQDGPAVAVLDGHRLHVGGGVDDPEAQAVDGQPGDEDASLRGRRDGSKPEGLQDEPGPRGVTALPLRVATSSARADPAPASSTTMSSSPETNSSERSHRVWNLGQAGGQGDEQQALDGEGAAATARRCPRAGRRRRWSGRWHCSRAATLADRRPPRRVGVLAACAGLAAWIARSGSGPLRGAAADPARPRLRRHRLLRLGDPAGPAHGRGRAVGRPHHHPAGRRAGAADGGRAHRCRGARARAGRPPRPGPGGLGGAARSVRAAARARRRCSRLRGILPADIGVRVVAVAADGFDARFSALQRRYLYRWPTTRQRPTRCAAATPSLVPDARARRRRHACRSAEAAGAATTSGPSASGARVPRRCAPCSTTRWRRAPDGTLEATVVADAFCHSMVRSLVGAVVPVGEGRKGVDWPARGDAAAGPRRRGAW